jgi:hypothetical protein
MTTKFTKLIAIAAAAAALAFGASALAGAVSDNNTSTTAASRGAVPIRGGRPGGGPGFGTPVTGATADKVAKAALAKHPGRIEHIAKLPDGSYVAHVITSKGELHVAVSKDFHVTGTQTGPRRGGAPAGGLLPGGAAPPSAGTSGRSS